MTKVKEIAATEGNQDYRKDYRVILRLDPTYERPRSQKTAVASTRAKSQSNPRFCKADANTIVFAITKLQPSQRPRIFESRNSGRDHAAAHRSAPAAGAPFPPPSASPFERVWRYFVMFRRGKKMTVSSADPAEAIFGTPAPAFDNLPPDYKKLLPFPSVSIPDAPARNSTSARTRSTLPTASNIWASRTGR